jgi:hypothetical protein
MTNADHWAKISQQAGKLQRREADIKVPGLSWIFPDGEPAVWVVRSLGASDFWAANEAGDRDKKLRDLVMAFAKGEGQGEKVREALGVSSADVPDEVRKRIALIERATVRPEIPEEHLHDIVLAIAEHHAEEFFAISNKVKELTVGGSVAGKPKGSTRTKASV